MTTNLALKAGRDIAYHTNRSGGGHAGGMTYYTQAAGEPPGRWAGKMAAKLGLSGDIDPGVIHRLFHQNISPDGEVLTGKAKGTAGEGAGAAVDAFKAEHPFASATEVAEVRSKALGKNTTARPYFDWALGAVKSVSLLHASLLVSAKQERDAGREDLAVRYEAEAQAIEDALYLTAETIVREVEGSAAYTRTGHHSRTTGEYRDAAGVSSGIFVQHTSHEGDPHLHAHITVHNLSQRADGADSKWRTLDSRVLFAQRLRIAALADREMEVRMTGLGWQMITRADGNGAEVAGVTRESIEMFSSRRMELAPEVRELAAEYKAKYGREPSGRTLWTMAQHVSMRQRAAHRAPDAPGDKLAAWEAQTTAREVQTLSTVHQAARDVARVEATDLDDGAKARAARIAAAEVQKHHAAFTMSQLVFEVARALPVMEEGEDSKAVITEVAGLAISGRSGTGVVRVTAGDIADVSPLGVRASDGGSVYRAPHDERFCTLDHLDVEEHIVKGAKREVRQLVTAEDARRAVEGTDLNDEQKDAVVLMLTSSTATTMLVAPAGSGKSHTMAAFARIWTQLTGKRVIGLTTSQNAAEVLKIEGLTESYNIAAFLGKIKDSDELRHPVSLYADDVLVLDESTQIGTRDWAMVQQAALEAGARMAPVGDTMQVGAVEAGGMFSLLASEVPTGELHEIRRFDAQWERDASVRMRRGEWGVTAAYDTRGRIRGADNDAAYERAATSWLGDYLRGKDVLLLAGSNAEASELSRRVQEKLVALGKVSELRARLADGNQVGVGDMIRARLNSHIDAGGRRLTNRDTLRITGWSGPFATAQRKAGSGWSESFKVPVSYIEKDAELSYGGNVFTAQGKTVDTAHLLVTETLSRPTYYVGMSRGRQANTAHVVTGDTAPEGWKPFEQATPEAVIKGIMQREPEDLSATAQIRASQEWSGGTGHVLHLWAAAARTSLYPEIDAQVKAHLSEADAWRYEKEHSRPVFQNKVREAQLAGHDVAALVARITATPMTGSRSISGVLHKRLEDLKLPVRNDVTWSQRTPQGAPALAHELAQGLDERAAALAERVIENPEPWAARHLGVLAADASVMLREDYARRAGIAAGYREAAGITDPEQAVGHPHKDNPELETARRAAMTALEVVDEQAAIRETPRGHLEAKIQHAERVQALAPPEVGARLRLSSQAEADAHRLTADAEVRQEAEQAEAARAQAEQAGAERVHLEAMQAAYEEWSAKTQAEREAADAAKAELARREVEPEDQAPEVDQEPEPEVEAPEPEIEIEIEAETADV